MKNSGTQKLAAHDFVTTPCSGLTRPGRWRQARLYRGGEHDTAQASPWWFWDHFRPSTCSCPRTWFNCLLARAHSTWAWKPPKGGRLFAHKPMQEPRRSNDVITSPLNATKGEHHSPLTTPRQECHWPHGHLPVSKPHWVAMCRIALLVSCTEVANHLPDQWFSASVPQEFGECHLLIRPLGDVIPPPTAWYAW